MNEFYLGEVLSQLNQFQGYLNDIEISDFKNLSRERLKEFRKNLPQCASDLSYEISKLIDKKKYEDYPQLLGVHNFHEIKDMSFLDEDKKIKLDKYIGYMRGGSYIHIHSGAFCKLRSEIGDELIEKALGKLVEFKIIEPYFSIGYCGNDSECCENDNILSDSKLKDFLRVVEKFEKDKIEPEEYELEVYSDGKHIFRCLYCSEEIELSKEKIKESLKSNPRHYKLIKERDSSLDFV